MRAHPLRAVRALPTRVARADPRRILVPQVVRRDDILDVLARTVTGAHRAVLVRTRARHAMASRALVAREARALAGLAIAQTFVRALHVVVAFVLGETHRICATLRVLVVRKPLEPFEFWPTA